MEVLGAATDGAGGAGKRLTSQGRERVVPTGKRLTSQSRGGKAAAGVVDVSAGTFFVRWVDDDGTFCLISVNLSIFDKL